MSGSRSLFKTLHVLLNGRLLVYNFLVLIYGPRILAKKIAPYRDKRKHLLDPNRWRCPVYNLREKTSAPRIVMTGVGWGEMRVTEMLSALLKEKQPDLDIVWSFCDFATIDVVRKEHPQQTVAFMPFDFLPPMLTWLRRLSPDVVVSIEKVLLPNLICASRSWGAQTITIGGRVGRLRGNSFTRGIYRHIYRWMFQDYTTLCLQGESDLAVLSPVLSPDLDVRITGAVKLSHSKREHQPAPPELRKWLSGTEHLPLLIAGSTREDEEEFVLKAFDIVRSQLPCVLLLAPRRLHRTDWIVSLLEEQKYRYSRRSQFQEKEASSTESTPGQVYLLDTLGELASAYQFSEAAYVGGTLYGRGHNVVEPVEWGVPVFFGPGRKGQIVPPQALCEKAGVGFRVRTPEELAAHWLKLLQEPELRATIKTQCKEVVDHQQQVLENTVDAIIEAVNKAKR